jgi:hypothetical protein
MQMPKATEEDKARFAALVVELPGAETKRLFGQLGARSFLQRRVVQRAVIVHAGLQSGGLTGGWPEPELVCPPHARSPPSADHCLHDQCRREV